MASSKIRSIRVAEETAFGSVDPATGLPDGSGLTWLGLQFDLAGGPDAIGGEVELVEDELASSGFFSQPPELSAPWAGGKKLDVRSGTISIRTPVRGFGTGGEAAVSSSMPLALIWASSMTLIAAPTSAPSVDVISAADLASCVTARPVHAWAAGEVVLAEIDGCTISNRITKVEASGGDDRLTFLQEWPRQLTAADTLSRGLNFAIEGGANSGARGASVALELKLLQATALAFGCRLESLIFEPAAGGVVVATMEIRCAWIEYETLTHAQAIPQASRYGSPAATLRGTRTRIGATNMLDAQAPASGAAITLPTEHEGWSLSLSFGLEPVGGSCLLGVGELEPSSVEVTLSLTSRVVSDHDKRDVPDSWQRSIAVAGAPIVSGSAPVNWRNGFGASIPAAFLTAPPDATPGSALLQQVRAYKAGAYSGDDAGIKNVVLYLGG